MKHGSVETKSKLPLSERLAIAGVVIATAAVLATVATKEIRVGLHMEDSTAPAVPPVARLGLENTQAATKVFANEQAFKPPAGSALDSHDVACILSICSELPLLADTPPPVSSKRIYKFYTRTAKIDLPEGRYINRVTQKPYVLPLSAVDYFNKFLHEDKTDTTKEDPYTPMKKDYPRWQMSPLDAYIYRDKIMVFVRNSVFRNPVAQKNPKDGTLGENYSHSVLILVKNFAADKDFAFKIDEHYGWGNKDAADAFIERKVKDGAKLAFTFPR